MRPAAQVDRCRRGVRLHGELKVVVMRDWRDSATARVGFVVMAVLCPAGIAIATDSGLSRWHRAAALVLAATSLVALVTWVVRGAGGRHRD